MSANLVETESYLKKLRLAMNLVETLKQEKDAYKINFERLRENHNELSEQLETLVDEREYDYREKANLEQENEYLVSQLRTVEFRAKELEELRLQMVQPRELELLRLQLTEDYEQNQRQTFDSLNVETEKYRNAYFSLKKDYELLKTDFDQNKLNHDSLTDEASLIHKEETRGLEKKMREMQNTIMSTSETDRLRTLQREHSELTAKCNNLSRENEELRAQKEVANTSHAQQERLTQRKLMEETTFSKTLASEKDGLLCKITALEDEQRLTSRQQDVLIEENRSLNKEIGLLRSRHEEAVHNFNLECSDLKMGVAKERADFNVRINEFRIKQNESQASLKSSTETNTTLRLKLSDAEKTHAEKVRIAREEEWSKIERLEKEKEDLQRTTNELRQKRSDLEHHLETLRKDHALELGRLRKETSEATVRNDSLTKQNQTFDTECEKLRNMQHSAQARLIEHENRNSQVSERFEELKALESNLREQLSHLEGHLESVEKERDSVSTMLNSEREHYQEKLEKFKTNWKKEQTELSSVLQTLETENVELRTQAEQDIKKISHLKSKSTDYKLMADNNKLEHDNLKKQWDVLKLKQNARSKELKQRQSEFMSLLQSELLTTEPRLNLAQ